MATIPIEIILQDTEAPVDPTPEKETNIVVPDTGTISNDGSNSGGISSSVGIILPIVIAILAIVTAIVSMIRKHHNKHFSSVMNKKEKLTTVASGTIAILAATVLVGNLVIPATKAATSVEPGTAELDTVDKITITATREIDSDITVATVKNTSYATANLDFGYKVTASMIEGATTANLYLDGDETSEYYIAPVENEDEGDENIENENIAGNAELTNNTWGYTLEEPSGDTTYLPIPLEDTPATITKGNDMVEDEAVDIYYTIKVDKSLPTGTYTGDIEYTIAPAVEYMQDFATMTEEEKTATLAYMPEGEQYILKDIRDEKPYYISKLADGNVWMTQNLDLQKEDLSVALLDSTNTDNPAKGYALPSSQIVGDISWNDGDYHVYDTGKNGQTYYNCIELQPWGECKTYSDTPISSCELGNLYSWHTSVAGTVALGEIGEATGSICPAGWRLPNGNAAGTETTFSNLLYIYNILSSPTSGGTNYDNFHEIFNPPINLALSGFYNEGIKEVGVSGVLASASSYNAFDGGKMYSVNFDMDRVNVFGGEYLTSGASIRCLMR